MSRGPRTRPGRAAARDTRPLDPASRPTPGGVGTAAAPDPSAAPARTGGGANVLALGDMHDVSTVRRLHAAAIAALDASGDVTADATGVAHLDTATLQVLIALRRSLASRGRALVVKDAGEPVRAALRSAGLEEAVLGGVPGRDQGPSARVEGHREVRP